MSKMKLLLYFLVFVCICIVIWILFLQDNVEEFTEYIPEEEISEEQERQSLVALYFRNIETKALMAEPRMCDAKKLLENPYQTLMEMLLEGPKNEKLESLIPQGTKLNRAELQSDMVVLDLSQEFTKTGDIAQEETQNIIDSIVNTLTELTEVTCVKFLVDGEEGKGFENGLLNFTEPFVRVRKEEIT